jgi:hypothetical protein
MWPRRVRTIPIRERVIVNDATGQSLDGVLTGVYDDWIVLAHATLLGDTTVKVDGEVWVPRHAVRFVQRPDL